MANAKFVVRYSRAERVLHRMAFASGGLQVSLADIEDRLYAKQFTGIPIDRPVFVTALPRAGTTVLLNLLVATGEFVSHTYRNMPFVLCPVLWQKFARGLRADDALAVERAHADGLTITLDSAEAFEEMIWQQFWPAHYRRDRIDPWTDEGDSQFEQFLRHHVHKLLWLAPGDDARRYVSKNNLNVARIALLRSLFPDARIVVPFRPPLQHAASLLRQHRNFLQFHREDSFTKAYMRGIGHYDFGENFLPVDFDGWLQGDRRADAKDLAFWLEYWVAAYRHVLSHRDDAIIPLPFARWIDSPRAGLAWLAEQLAIREPQALLDQHHQLHAGKPHAVDETAIPRALLDEARDVFDQLNAASSLPAAAGPGE